MGLFYDLLIKGHDIPYIGAKKNTNGFTMMCELNDESAEWVSKGHCIVFVCISEGSAGYTTYQDNDFIGMKGKTICGYPKYDIQLNHITGSFINTVLSLERPKYSFGRSWTGERLENTVFKLPVDSCGEPDWKFMEKYIKKLQYKSISTKIKSSNKNINFNRWQKHKIGDLFNVVYGVNLELNALEQTTIDDTNGIAFVSRTEEDNGISAYVKKIDDIEPQKEGTLTVACGGSALSTFLQTKPFYSGRDLYLLLEKEPMSIYSKLFIKTVIEQNKYRFEFGRQANKSLPNLVIKLSTKKNGKLDYKYMENYIKSLPYGDRI